VKFAVEQAAAPVPELAYVTDSDGHARIGLPAGEATLRFFLPGGRSETSVLRIANEPGRIYVVRLAMDREAL
jgi:hypothetical protein